MISGRQFLGLEAQTARSRRWSRPSAASRTDVKEPNTDHFVSPTVRLMQEVRHQQEWGHEGHVRVPIVGRLTSGNRALTPG